MKKNVISKAEKFWNKTARKYSREKIKDQKGYQKTLDDTRRYLGPEANVIVTDDMLKFHNHDRRKEYLKRWENISDL